LDQHLLIVAGALAVDALVGDPPWLYRRLTHPVAIMGQLISAGDQRLNNPTHGIWQQRTAGVVLTFGVIAVACLAGAIGQTLIDRLPGGAIIEALAASTLLAGRSLYQHVLAVAVGLGDSLENAREAIAHIVGRDPQGLDEAGVARAAIESLAENFSDGVVAPVFWYAVLGLPGLLAYKAINTLDSMVGYRNYRYQNFGKASAKVDDWANWFPARLAGYLICAAALVLSPAQAKNAVRIMHRDAGKHRSPNAGWPEAAMAGALGFSLAGPRRYPAGWVEDPWVGDGRSALDALDIHAALSLYPKAILVLGVLLGGSWAFFA